MASLRQTRNQIRSVKNTRQITKAMQMVAAAKLKKSEFRLMSSRPYCRKMEELMNRLLPSVRDLSHPLLDSRTVKSTLLVIVASDKGLCGSYNMNIIRKAEEFLLSKPKDHVKLAIIGKKAYDYFKRRQWPIVMSITDLLGNVDYARINQVTQKVIGIFESGEADEIYLLHTRYLSAMRYEPTMFKYLPFEIQVSPDSSAKKSGHEMELDYIFEPDAAKIFHDFLPRYLGTRMFSAVAESFTSEHSARMISMKNATTAAQDMIDSLTLKANKIRQAQITKEISEIVGGSEALKS